MPANNFGVTGVTSGSTINNVDVDITDSDDSSNGCNPENNHSVCITGPKGDDGRDGRDGQQGDVGPAGTNGSDGRDGKDGKDGKDGRDGSQGLVGPPGQNGQNGQNGQDGTNGSPGLTGPPGPQGTQGIIGHQGIPGETSPGGPAGFLDCGFFTDSTTQTNPVANAVNIARFNVTGPANGISLVGGDAITVVNAGTYTKLFTLIAAKTAGGTSVISVWLRLNGVDVLGSRQDLNLSNPLALIFVSGNFTLNIPAGGNIQLCWSSADTAVSLSALPAGLSPARPPGNSVKLTLTRVS